MEKFGNTWQIDCTNFGWQKEKKKQGKSFWVYGMENVLEYEKKVNHYH